VEADAGEKGEFRRQVLFGEIPELMGDARQILIPFRREDQAMAFS